MKIRVRTIKLLAIFSIFFFTSCANRSPISSLTINESRSLEDFFEELLFENSAVYTLFGSKPLSIACVLYAKEQSETQYLDALFSMPLL